MQRRFRRLRLVVGCASVLAIALTSSARAHAQADLAELHGFIEPCTIANYQEMFTECEACPVSHESPKACEQSLGQRGYTKKCRTRGDAHAWEEVWCVAKGSPESEPGPERAPRPVNVPALLLAAALFAAFLWMWRAWSHQRSAR